MYINSLEMGINTTKEIKVLESISIRYSTKLGINIMATVRADKIKIKKYANLTEIYIIKDNRSIIYSEIKEPNYIYVKDEINTIGDNIYKYTTITYNFLKFYENELFD